MINLKLNEQQLQKTAAICKKKDLILPTFAQMKDPALISQKIKNELKNIGLWDVHNRNLFRVSWANEPTSIGGGYSGVNFIEIPPSLTRIKARVIGLTGKWFPTGAHKVGTAYSCLAPTLVTGQFDPAVHKAVWPSTGNFCRGGAYISKLLGCDSIAILPEGMSRERFDWLANIAGETIATPGSESNVKEIFDKCWELKEKRGEKLFIYNQFEELGNHLWHYEVTGHAMHEVLKKNLRENDNYAGACLSSGSGGTLASGEFLKTIFPHSKLAVAEALQCPTLLANGFGSHRIEGIGDKHVPWIHNVKNTDMVITVDDEIAVRLLRLFNETIGREYLAEKNIPKNVIDNLDLLGISGIGNLIAATKFAKYYELSENDVVLTIFTDSFDLYHSRLDELSENRGKYTRDNAVIDFELINHIGADNLLELSYLDKKRIHNLKYYTWIEQQQKDLDELNAQWYDNSYWADIYKQVDTLDQLIREFNAMVQEA